MWERVREGEGEGEGEGGREGEGEMVTSSKVEQTTTVPTTHVARVLLRIGPLPLYPRNTSYLLDA